MSSENEPSPPGGFPTTRWSRVVAAGEAGPSGPGEALAELCRAYWYPIYAFIRRKGHAPDLALDLAQSYFARLIERGAIAAVDPARGRFRSFLRADCGFFLADQLDRDRALKRGGGVAPLSIDARDAEGRYLVEPVDDETPDRLFDRAWAVALIARAFDRLAAEHREPARARLFDHLKGVLAGGSKGWPQAVRRGRSLRDRRDPRRPDPRAGRGRGPRAVRRAGPMKFQRLERFRDGFRRRFLINRDGTRPMIRSEPSQ
jgi:RNA polymerase sigma-70 factor (ECF subfamily)